MNKSFKTLERYVLENKKDKIKSREPTLKLIWIE